MASSTETDRGSTPIVVGHVTIVLASIVVVLRFISRGYILRVLGLTDIAIAFSLLLSIAYTAFMIILIRTGYGLHMWELTAEQLKVYFKMVYAVTILYTVAVIMTKVSILLLYLDVFSTTGIRRFAYTIFAAVVIHGTWITFSNVFFCIPIHAFWDFTLPRDSCFDTKKWFYEMWLHIALDFAIFLLPLPVIRSMTLPKRQKFWLFGVFSLGFMVCVVACVRLYYMYHIVTSDDPTYDSMVLIILCFLELNLSIAIPCVITIKPLLDRVLPGLLGRKGASKRNLNGSPERPDESLYPPTISSPPPRPRPRDIEMDDR